MYYHLVKFPIVYSLSLVIWPLAYGEDYGGNGETLFRGGGMDSLTVGREIPFSFVAYVLRTCKVWYRMARIRSPYLLAALPKLNINFTGCAIDNFVAACYNGITRKGKEGKHDVCKDELEGSKGKVQ